VVGGSTDNNCARLGKLFYFGMTIFQHMNFFTVQITGNFRETKQRSRKQENKVDPWKEEISLMRKVNNKTFSGILS
jgi:hypothetical protein